MIKLSSPQSALALAVTLLTATCLLLPVPALSTSPGADHKKQVIVAASDDTSPLANSLPGITLAVAAGVDFIELDLVATADNRIVVHHSTDLARTTNAREILTERQETEELQVTAMSLDEIRRLRTSSVSGLGDPAPSLPIPTLKEAVDLIRHIRGDGRPGLLLNIVEPAHYTGKGLDLASPVVEAIARQGIDLQEMPLMIQCSESDVLMRIKKLTGPLLLDIPLIQRLTPPPEPEENGEVTTLMADQSWMFTVSGTRLLASYATAVSLTPELLGEDESGPVTPLFLENLRTLGIDIYLEETADRTLADNSRLPLKDLLAKEEDTPGFDGLITAEYTEAIKSRQLELRRENAPILFPGSGDSQENIIFH